MIFSSLFDMVPSAKTGGTLWYPPHDSDVSEGTSVPIYLIRLPKRCGSWRRSSPAPRNASLVNRLPDEHDWAFAKRALARGDDPEDVIQQIAQRRARDKSDPQYYARLTVTKAQAELQRQSNAEQPGEDQRTPSKAIALDH